MSLNETLKSLGYYTIPVKGDWCAKHILFAGSVVFTGDAGEVWEWLRKSGLIQ
jgi:hypothetical protein